MLTLWFPNNYTYLHIVLVMLIILFLLILFQDNCKCLPSKWLPIYFCKLWIFITGSGVPKGKVFCDYAKQQFIIFIQIILNVWILQEIVLSYKSYFHAKIKTYSRSQWIGSSEYVTRILIGCSMMRYRAGLLHQMRIWFKICVK